MRSLTKGQIYSCSLLIMIINLQLKLTVLASVKGLYSSRPPGGADRVTWVTEGSYRGERSGI